MARVFWEKMSESQITTAWSPDPDTDQRLVALHDYWAGLARDGAVPWRRDFQPRDIPDLLPFVFLLEVLPGEFRFRLAGARYTEAVGGRDVTGLTTADIYPPQFRTAMLDRWAAVVREGRPLWASGPMWDTQRNFLSWRSVLLPLRVSGGAIGQLLGAAVFTQAAGKTRRTKNDAP